MLQDQDRTPTKVNNLPVTQETFKTVYHLKLL